MTQLLEIREKIKNIYSKNEVFIIPIVKFFVAFIMLSTLNKRMGYMAKIDKTAIVLMVSLLCSFLPSGCMVFFGAVFSLLHMYALGLEAAAIGLALYLILFILFFRFMPKQGLLIAITPLLFAMKIPYVLPIAVGLLFAPTAIICLCCGVVIFYFLETIMTSAATLNTMGDDILAKIRFLIDALLDNKIMIVVAAAFAVTALCVYLLRRLSVDYAWTIAIAAGAIVDIVILIIGAMKFDLDLSAGGIVLGSILAVAIAVVIQFFRFFVDYNRTERVQFEDDEYYYYVKAVPKMSVAVSSKTVKKINSQRKAEPERTEKKKRTTEEGYLSSGASMTVGSTDDEAYNYEGYDDVVEPAGYDDAGNAYYYDEEAGQYYYYDEDGNALYYSDDTSSQEYSGEADYTYEEGNYAEEDDN